MSSFISNRLSGMVQSDIRRMTRECNRVGGINLGQGICDLPTPPLVERGAIDAIKARKSTYSVAEGVPDLRQAIARKLRRDNGMKVAPETEIVVTAGATGAFTLVLNALLNPGDGILILEPYYNYHLNMALLAGLKPHFLTLEAPDFRLDLNALRQAIRPSVRAILVCTPSNPCGKMFDAEDLAALDRVAEEHDLLVVTDEIYEYIRYDGRPHISPATVGSLRERTVSIMGFSKTFSITGWRLGYALAPPEMARAMTLVNDLFYVCAPTPLQWAVVEGLKAPARFYEDLREGYTRKRALFCTALQQVGLEPIVPQGAYYVLADIRRLGYPTATDAALALLEETKVASIPGTAFYTGSAGNRFLRFCFAKEDDVLEEASNRIRKFRG